MRRKLVAVLAVALMIAAAIAAGPAGATFAGQNGRIVFEHLTGSAPQQLVTVTPRGTHARTLTDFNREATSPAFSPRGGRIAFTLIGTPHIPDKLFTIRAGGANLRKISHGCVGSCLGDAEVAWSPDGRRLAFNRAYGPIVDDSADHVDLMVMNRNGTDQRVILHSNELNGKRRFEPSVQSWSPDGEQLALVMYDLDSPRLATAIYTFELDSGDLHRITPWRLNAGNPDYSPTGRRIVFNSHYEGQGHSSLYTIAPGGTGMRRLNHPRKHYTFAPRFSPSGNQIVYVVAGRATTIHLSRMTVGGRKRSRVTRDTLRAFNPDWGARP